MLQIPVVSFVLYLISNKKNLQIYRDDDYLLQSEILMDCFINYTVDESFHNDALQFFENVI